MFLFLAAVFNDNFLLFFADGELEAEWLVAAGFPHLTKAFEEVRIRVEDKWKKKKKKKEQKLTLFLS